MKTEKQLFNKREPPTSMYGSYDLQKYHKHLGRLYLDGNIVCRQFFGNSGRNFVKQVVIPKQLQKELMYRILNSKIKGNLGTTNTIQRIRKKFYFAGHTEILITYIILFMTVQELTLPNRLLVQNKCEQNWYTGFITLNLKAI